MAAIERDRTPGNPWQEALGSARAVAAGDLVLVAGTMPDAAGAAAIGDPYEQARSALAASVAALEPFGLGAEAVVRTRMYLSHARDAEEVARAHRDLFGDVRPVATLVVVAGLADSRVLVQVEIEAHRDAGAGTATRTTSTTATTSTSTTASTTASTGGGAAA